MTKIIDNNNYSVAEALDEDNKNALIFGGIGLIRYDENRNIVWASDLFYEQGLRIIGEKLLEWQPLLAPIFEDEDINVVDINSRKYEVIKNYREALDVEDLTEKLTDWIDKRQNRDLIFYLTMIVLTIILYLYLHIKCNIQMQSFNPLADCINPVEMKHGVYYKIGFMLGVFTGWILERRFVNFSIINNLKKKIILISAGLIFLYTICALCTKILLLILPDRFAYSITAFLIPFYIIFLYPVVIKIFESR